MAVYPHTTNPAVDAATAWQASFAYTLTNNEQFSARVPAAGGPFLDILGATLTLGKLYNFKYPTDQTSGAALDIAEFAKMETVGAVVATGSGLKRDWVWNGPAHVFSSSTHQVAPGTPTNWASSDYVFLHFYRDGSGQGGKKNISLWLPISDINVGSIEILDPAITSRYLWLRSVGGIQARAYGGFDIPLVHASGYSAIAELDAPVPAGYEVVELTGTTDASAFDQISYTPPTGKKVLYYGIMIQRPGGVWVTTNYSDRIEEPDNHFLSGWNSASNLFEIFIVGVNLQSRPYQILVHLTNV